MLSFDGKYQYTKVAPCSLELALTVSEIVTFKIFNLQKVGQGHGVQLSQKRYSMSNIKVYNVLLELL